MQSVWRAYTEQSFARLVHIRITIGLVVLCVILAGCTATPKLGLSGWTEFALSTPEHLEDWRRLQTALATASIRCTDGDSNLGGLSLLVHSRDFDRAKQEATGLVVLNSLTLRICASTGSWTYEVWHSGKKVREDTYVIEKSK
jgi:hypothetical protein